MHCKMTNDQWVVSLTYACDLNASGMIFFCCIYYQAPLSVVFNTHIITRIKSFPNIISWHLKPTLSSHWLKCIHSVTVLLMHLRSMVTGFNYSTLDWRCRGPTSFYITPLSPLLKLLRHSSISAAWQMRLIKASSSADTPHNSFLTLGNECWR